MKRITKSIALLALLLSSNAMAATSTATTKATATLASTCTINATTLAFGEVSVVGTASANASGTGNIALTCTRGTSFTIQLNLGANTTAGEGRYLADTKGNKIPYIICQTSSLQSQAAGHVDCLNIWYTGNSNNWPLTGTGTGATQNIPTYGFFQTGTYVPGNYSDTTTATITY